MKTLFLTLAFLLMIFLTNAQNVEIPDAAFLHALIDKGIDTDGDSLISLSEAEAVSGLFVDGCNISNLTGIEAFINLEFLVCSNNHLTRLDLTNNIHLSRGVWFFPPLDCSNNQLTSLDLSNNTELEGISCENNQLTHLDLSKNTKLLSLSCSNNQLTGLDVSNNKKLKTIFCGNNQLTHLDVSNNINLLGLYIEEMPSLYEVCVWITPFPPDTVNVDTSGSTNVYFTTDCSTTNISEKQNNNSISLYPNPVIDMLYIETGNIINSDFEIYSMSGILLFKKELNSDFELLDISNYKNGIYIAKITTDNAIYTRKILIKGKN